MELRCPRQACREFAPLAREARERIVDAAAFASVRRAFDASEIVVALGDDRLAEALREPGVGRAQAPSDPLGKFRDFDLEAREDLGRKSPISSRFM